MRWLFGLGVLFLSPIAFAQSADAPHGSGKDGKHTHWEHRVPPQMPFMAFRSGYCCTSLQSRPDGEVTVANGMSCSDDFFEPMGRLAVSEWRFHPSSREDHGLNGKPVKQVLSWRLNNKAGICIPDANGWMCDADGGFKKVEYDLACRGDLAS